MRLSSTLIVALRALRRNKLRSMLTALGIIIGVAAVIAMVSIGNGAKTQVEAQVASLGQNVITVFSGSFTGGAMRGGWGSAPTLTLDDANAITREVAGVAGVSPEVRSRDQVLANGLNWNTQIIGEGPDFVTIRTWPVARGAMFTDQDVRSVAKVAVIGQTIVDQLFPGEDPIGQTLRIRNIPFKIVGVLSPKGFNLFGQDQDDTVIVPYTSHMKRLSKRTNIASILVQAASSEVIAKVQQDITDALMQRRQGKDHRTVGQRGTEHDTGAVAVVPERGSGPCVPLWRAAQPRYPDAGAKRIESRGDHWVGYGAGRVELRRCHQCGPDAQTDT